MTRRRFFAPPDAFNFEHQTVTLTADEARHIRHVLRLKAGAEVYVFDGAGKEFCCSVSKTARDSAELEIKDEVEPAKPESPLKLTLALALLKGEKFDLVVQKATELGIIRIVPVTTRFADIHIRDESDARKRVARWQRIGLESAKQSGRAVVPEVSMPVSFEALMVRTNLDTSDEPRCLMFSERDGAPLADVLRTTNKATAVISLVGSEGGWSDEEIQQARSTGWQIVTLGGRVLRAETAAIATTVLVQHLYGDLK